MVVVVIASVVDVSGEAGPTVGAGSALSGVIGASVVDGEPVAASDAAHADATSATPATQIAIRECIPSR